MYGRFFFFSHRSEWCRVMFKFIVVGVQFIKDCPKEPYIPVYMLIGGVLGTVRMLWALYSQIRSRRPEVLSVPATTPYVSPMKLLSVALSCFLVAWFVLGKQFEISFGIIRVAFYIIHPAPTASPNFPSFKASEDLLNKCRAVLRKRILYNIQLHDPIITLCKPE